MKSFLILTRDKKENQTILSIFGEKPSNPNRRQKRKTKQFLKRDLNNSKKRRALFDEIQAIQ